MISYRYVYTAPTARKSWKYLFVMVNKYGFFKVQGYSIYDKLEEVFLYLKQIVFAGHNIDPLPFFNV